MYQNRNDNMINPRYITIHKARIAGKQSIEHFSRYFRLIRHEDKYNECIVRHIVRQNLWYVRMCSTSECVVRQNASML